MEFATVMRLAGHVDAARLALDEAISIYVTKHDLVSERRAREMLASP